MAKGRESGAIDAERRVEGGVPGKSLGQSRDSSGVISSETSPDNKVSKYYYPVSSSALDSAIHFAYRYLVGKYMGAK
jgi:hypothetical protein